jgi:hypothetical protein
VIGQVRRGQNPRNAENAHRRGQNGEILQNGHRRGQNPEIPENVQPSSRSQNGEIPQNASPALGKWTSAILIKFREAIITTNPFDQFDPVQHVATSGLYPRGSMNSAGAAIGGLLVPFLLLVAVA